MNESPVLFGPDRSSIGVVTDPARASNGTGVLFLNAGFTHHVGPQRMHVEFARRWAEQGFTALRFDYSAIGDSPRRARSMAFADRAIEEAVHAMDFLAAARGVTRFVLFGVCWGADNAIRVASVDPRVAGVIAVDPYAVMSMRWFVRFYARRALSPARWLNVVRGRSAVFGRAAQLLASLRARSPREESDGRELLPMRSPDAVRAELTGLVRRGVRLCLAYATVGGSLDRYVIDFRRALSALPTDRLAVRVFAASDHVFTLLHSQAGLWEYVDGWARGFHRAA